MSPFLRIAAVAAGLLVAAPSSGQSPQPVTAELIDGTSVAGDLTSFEPGSLRIRTAGRPERSVPREQVLSLRFAEGKASSVPETVLEFANGDRIAAEVLSVDEDFLQASFGGDNLTVPLETLRGIALRPLDPDDGSPALFLRESGDDLVLLTNDDRLTGQFVGLSETELRLEAGERETRVPRDRIAAVAFSPELISPAEVDGPRQIVRSPAGWLTVRDLIRDGELWRGVTAFGAAVSWPAAEVDRLRFAGARAEFLSDVEPAAAQIEPYLERRWKVRKDRDVTGAPLAAGGDSSPKGLGVHSRSRVTYDLDGRYVRFGAVVGLSPSAGDAGSAEFAVEVDGREVYRSGPVTAADAKPVTVDLNGAERLVLTVDFGRNGDVRDRANWCDAVLVRR